MEKTKADTIAAIATPVGNGGIGIVRISGPSAHRIAQRIFRKQRLPDSSLSDFSVRPSTVRAERKLILGHIVDPATGRVIDEALLAIMTAPNSYTCEDVAEIQAHANSIGLKIILGLVLNCGARLAEPGEFTKRAFLNGRIDLTQAEAVSDLINARTEKALRLATEQLSGRLGEKIRCISEELRKALSEIEASIDFSEDAEEVLELEASLKHFGKDVFLPLKTLLKSYDDGHLLREGLRLVIVGRPNVGKSSLMNSLLKKERAIVTPVPGTTRDTIEEHVNINGLPVSLSDTAGVHDSDDPVETIGIQRTEKIAGEADLILFMIDAGSGVTDDDSAIFEKIKGKPVILIVNKIDLESGEKRTGTPEEWNVLSVVRTSVRFDKGIEVLKEKIYENSIGLNGESEAWIVPNLRQKKMLEKCLSSAETAEKGAKEGVPPELTAIDLREAIGALNQIVGEDPKVDILDDIFSRFCIGK